MSWIVVKNWFGEKGFQHYRDRNPTWIKVYPELMSDDDYLSLPVSSRGVLVAVWLEFARSDGRLPLKSLHRVVGEGFRNHQLAPLINAGFIEISASKPSRISASVTRARERREEKRREEQPLRQEPHKQAEPKQREAPAPEEAVEPKAKTPAAEKPRDELWDALAEELGEPETRSERGRRNKALKELREIGVEANEVRHRIRSYRRKWPEIELTATALVANWSSLANGTFQPEPKFRCEVCGFGSLTDLRMNEHKANVHGLEVPA